VDSVPLNIEKQTSASVVRFGKKKKRGLHAELYSRCLHFLQARTLSVLNESTGNLILLEVKVSNVSFFSEYVTA
jgi:hypothetical protein